MAITSDYLLRGVKRRAVIPSSQSLLDDDDMLEIADTVISSRIVPLLESVQQDFFVIKDTTTVVAGQSEYSIPYRAVARGLRELKLSDGTNTRNLPLISLEDAHAYGTSSTSIAGFYFIGDKIRLVPDVASTLTATLTLEFWYRLPPSKLIASTDAALVSSVSDPSVVVTSVPSTLTAGVSVDFVQGKSGNSIYAMDKAISNVAGTTLTFAASTVPSTLAAGDYVCVAGESPVLNSVPNECYGLIESLVAQRILQSIGDFEGAKALSEDISTDLQAAKQILEPRMDGEPTIIINRQGLVRGNKFGSRGWLLGD